MHRAVCHMPRLCPAVTQCPEQDSSELPKLAICHLPDRRGRRYLQAESWKLLWGISRDPKQQPSLHFGLSYYHGTPPACCLQAEVHSVSFSPAQLKCAQLQRLSRRCCWHQHGQPHNFNDLLTIVRVCVCVRCWDGCDGGNQQQQREPAPGGAANAIHGCGRLWQMAPDQDGLQLCVGVQL